MYYSVAVPVRVGFDVESEYPIMEHFFTSLFLLDIVGFEFLYCCV
jgi:hypothetical protein